MDSPPKAHRASAQRRRAALLEAAAALAAEVGAGAVTHRAIAARAGVPLSTTSYFFGSIDELMTEALRLGVDDRVSDFDAAERVAVLAVDAPAAAVIDAVADQTLASAREKWGGQVEFFLAAGRQPELQPLATASVERGASRMAQQLSRAGAANADDAAWALAALGDGAMLHRLAGVDTDHRRRLTAGMRLLVAAAMLSTDEVDELLARYDQRATADAAPASV